MFYIIVNPASKTGLGKQRFEELKAHLNANHFVYKVFFTDKKYGATKCVEQFVELMKSDIEHHTLIDDKNPDPVLAVLGGDGTMNEVVTALCKAKKTEPLLHDISIAYLPTGSSNDLARSLKLTADIDEFLKRFKSHTRKHTDLGHITKTKGSKKSFAVSCGMGVDAAVCKEALDSPIKTVLNRLHLGKLTYAVIALKQIFASPMSTLDVTLDDGTVQHFDNTLFAVAMIQPYEGGGIMMTPKADCNDGMFDLLVVANLKRWQALYLLPLAFFGKHEKSKAMHFIKSKSLHLKSGTPLVVHADGEYCGTLDEITLECEKDGLTYI